MSDDLGSKPDGEHDAISDVHPSSTSLTETPSTRRTALGMTAAATAAILADRAIFAPGSARAEPEIVESVNKKTGKVVDIAEVNTEGKLLESQLPTSVANGSSVWYVINTAGMTGTVDYSATWQEILDSGHRKIFLIGGGILLLNKAVFYDNAESIYGSYEIDGDGSSKLKLGTELPTVSTFTTEAGVGWAFHVNNKRTALSGGVVTYSAANRAAGYTRQQRLRFGDGLIIETATAKTGLVFANTASVEIGACALVGLKYGSAWYNYADGGIYRSTSILGMEGGGWFVVGENGDGLVFEGIRAFDRNGIGNLTGNAGCNIVSCINGGFKFTSCVGVSIGNPHFAEESMNLTVTVDRSEVTIRDGFVNPEPGTNTIYLNDNAEDAVNASRVTLYDTTFDWYIRSTLGDVSRTPDIYINAANKGTKLRIVNTRATVRREGFAEVTPSKMLIASAIETISTALTNAKHLLGSDTWELAFSGEAWRVTAFSPLAGITTQRQLSRPTFFGAVTAGTTTTGTLSEGKTYAYAMACLDIDGYYTQASTESSVEVTASKSTQFQATVGTTPCTVRVWRKAAAGVLATPTAYVDIPIDSAMARFIDTGANLNGVPWITSEVPIPETVAAANETWERVRATVSGVSMGSGNGSPQEKYPAVVGSTYTRTDTGVLWIKKTGTGKTGWEESGAKGEKGEAGNSPNGVLMPITACGCPVAISSAAIGIASRGFFMRSVVPKAGKIRDITIWNGATVAGNVRAAILDLGEAHAGKYTVLWEGETLAQGTTNTEQSLGAPELTVVSGQELLLALMSSSTTATFGRTVLSVPAAAVGLQLPTNYLPAAGGALPKLVGAHTYSSFSFGGVGVELAEASLEVPAQSFYIIGRVA